MEIDLNQPGQQDEDNLQEVIINPAHPLQGDFIELNDILHGNNVVEEVLLQQNIPAPGVEEQALLNLALVGEINHVPLLPVQPVDVLDEEIHPDQLIDFDENGLPVNLDDDQVMLDHQENGNEDQNGPQGGAGQKGPQGGNAVLHVGMVLL